MKKISHWQRTFLLVQRLSVVSSRELLFLLGPRQPPLVPLLLWPAGKNLLDREHRGIGFARFRIDERQTEFSSSTRKKIAVYLVATTNGESSMIESD